MPARSEFSTNLAQYFLRVLREELEKPAEIVEAMTKEGVKYGETVEQVLLELLQAFPEVEQSPEAPYNLYRKWVTRADLPSFQKTSFRLYNRAFLARILDIKEGTEESATSVKARIKMLLSTGTFYGQDFTFALFFRAESSMRELLRSIADECSASVRAECHVILNQSSETWAEIGFDHFDGVIKGALNESERLLLNILPAPVAAELKASGSAAPVSYASATVVFTDFEGFTKIAERMQPTELIAELDMCFSFFDQVILRNGLEKIKTIGDAYMFAGGLPAQNKTHAVDAVLAAMEIQSFMNQTRELKQSLGLNYWQLRLGIHTGPLVAGVIGQNKFSYDIWGDTVNTASRMESAGETGKINISETTYLAVRDFFETEARGKLEAKNKGPVEMYFVTRIRPELSKDEEGRVPNESFHRLRQNQG